MTAINTKTMKLSNAFFPFRPLFSIPLAVFGCGVTLLLAHSALAEDFQEDYVTPIETAHGAPVWWSKGGVKAHIRNEFGGKLRFEGTMVMNPSASRTRMELSDGTVVVFDGEKCWVSPVNSKFEAARFHALTWPYFLAAPMKLGDRGTKLEDLGTLKLNGKKYDGARLTFEEGVGDAPDDWYVLYRDPDSHALAAMAYVVTYFGGDAAPAKEPHAVTYEKFETVEGVQVPTLWKFWNWSMEKGLAESLGKVEISEVEFVTPDADAFTKPEGAKEDAMPE